VKLTRRHFIYLAGAAAVATAIGGYYWLSTRSEKRTLKIYNYSSYINPDIIKDFEAKYNVKVIYDEYESADEAFAKLQLGGGGYDLIVLTDQYVPQAVKKGLIQPLNKEKTPNLRNLDSLFLENRFDPGLNYSVPYAWGTTGIGINTDYVEEGEVSGYEQLFDTKGFLPKHKSKVSMLEEFLEVVNAAKLYLGIPLDDWSDQAVQRIIDLLRSQRDFLAGYYGASVYIPSLAKGDLHAAQAWSGDVVQAQSENQKVKYVLPKEGAYIWIDFMTIPKNSQAPDLAHLWINYMLDPEVAAKNVNYIYYPSPIRKELLRGLVDEQILSNPAIYPPETAKLIQTMPISEEILSIIEQISTAVKKV